MSRVGSGDTLWPVRTFEAQAGCFIAASGHRRPPRHARPSRVLGVGSQCICWCFENTKAPLLATVKGLNISKRHPEQCRLQHCCVMLSVSLHGSVSFAGALSGTQWQRHGNKRANKTPNVARIPGPGDCSTITGGRYRYVHEKHEFPTWLPESLS